MSGGGISAPTISAANATQQTAFQAVPLGQSPPGGGPALGAPLINSVNQSGFPSGALNTPLTPIGLPNNFIFPGLSTSGFSAGPEPGGTGYYLGLSGGASDALQGLQQTYAAGANAIGALGQTVQPGFSLFRQAGLQSIENQRQSTQSNLQGNLAQRRVQGSSFANSAISNSNADFAEQSANFIASSYLQELNASSQLTQQQYTMAAQGYQSTLNELNITGELGAQMSAQMASTLASVSETQGQLDLSSAQTNAQGAIAQMQTNAQVQTQQAQMQLQAQEFNAQMQMAEMMGIGQLAGGLGGSLLGGGGGMGKSDIRVKRDIKPTGEWLNGLPRYVFRYISDPRWFVGFMAQDVEKLLPISGVYEVLGIKHVNHDCFMPRPI